MIEVAYLALLVAAGCFGTRMLQGRTMADRVVGLNGLIIVGMGAIAANAVDTGRGAFLPVLVVLALVGFLGTVMVGRYIESRGR
jgi:multisubunit Na+/H+ antiporter MnhF subunit